MTHQPQSSLRRRRPIFQPQLDSLLQQPAQQQTVLPKNQFVPWGKERWDQGSGASRSERFSIYSAVKSNSSRLGVTRQIRNPLARQEYEDQKLQYETLTSKMDRRKADIQKKAKNKLVSMDFAIKEEPEFQLDQGHKVYFKAD